MTFPIIFFSCGCSCKVRQVAHVGIDSARREERQREGLSEGGCFQMKSLRDYRWDFQCNCQILSQSRTLSFSLSLYPTFSRSNIYLYFMSFAPALLHTTVSVRTRIHCRKQWKKGRQKISDKEENSCFLTLSESSEGSPALTVFRAGIF
jgi:hypothetical protein